MGKNHAKTTYPKGADAPARVVIDEIWCGIASFCKDLGFTYPTVQRWYDSGVIPWWHHESVFKAAQDLGKPIKKDHFNVLSFPTRFPQGKAIQPVADQSRHEAAE